MLDMKNANPLQNSFFPNSTNNGMTNFNISVAVKCEIIISKENGLRYKTRTTFNGHHYTFKNFHWVKLCHIVELYKNF